MIWAVKGSTYAAGWDLRREVKGLFWNFILKEHFFSAYDYTLPAKGKITAQTDIQIAVPIGCYGRVG